MATRMRTVMCLVVLVFLLCWCFTDAFPDAANTRPSAIRYNTADLLALRSLPLVERANLKIPIELRARKRGKRGGVRVRNRKWGFKPFLPSAIIGNVQSLQNKLDELDIWITPTTPRPPQPTTHNPQPTTHNPQPITHNPQPTTPQPTAISRQPICGSWG